LITEWGIAGRRDRLGNAQAEAMFTGLVEAIGEVVEVEAEGPGRRLVVRAPPILPDAAVGESISVNGCCLTVVSCNKELWEFQAGPETLSRTNLGELKAGSAVNLERSLKLGDRVSGHLVTGHIDGLGTVDRREDYREWSTFWFRAPRELLRQMAPKGSISVDGVSLTLVSVDDDRFSVQLIPHTLAATTIGRRRAGDRVNLETDLLAKYVERQLAGAANRVPEGRDN
jgi:riboflavin synthase